MSDPQIKPEPDVQSFIPSKHREQVDTICGMGYEKELVRFALYHSNESFLQTVNNLLKFESQHKPKGLEKLLELALWSAGNDHLRAVKLISEFRSAEARNRAISTEPNTMIQKHGVKRKAPSEEVQPTSVETLGEGQASEEEVEIASVEIVEEDIQEVDREGSMSSQSASSLIAKADSRNKVRDSKESDNEPILECYVRDPHEMEWAANIIMQMDVGKITWNNASVTRRPNWECLFKALQIDENTEAIRLRIFDVETLAYPDQSKCSRDTNMKTLRLRFNCTYCGEKETHHELNTGLVKVVWLAMQDHPLSEDEFTQWALNWPRYTSWSRLCGNYSCKRPSHFLFGDSVAAEARTKCQKKAKGKPGMGKTINHQCQCSLTKPCMLELTLPPREDVPLPLTRNFSGRVTLPSTAS